MNYHYCPKCGGGLKEIFLKEEKQSRLKCQKCGFVFCIYKKYLPR